MTTEATPDARAVDPPAMSDAGATGSYIGNVRIVFRRELAAYFSAPIAIVVFVIFHVAAVLLTFYGLGRDADFWTRGYADMEPFFALLPWLLLFFVPALSMRLWAEERQTGSLELLLTLPLRTSEILLGKYLAAWAIVSFMLLLPSAALLAMLLGIGEPDVGQIVASFLGAVLMGGAYLALGSFLSSLTKDQIVAFIVTVIAAAAISFVGAEPVRQALAALDAPTASSAGGATLEVSGGGIGTLLSTAAERISLATRFESIGRGVLRVPDLVYYTLFIGFFLYLNALVLRFKR